MRFILLLSLSFLFCGCEPKEELEDDSIDIEELAFLEEEGEEAIQEIPPLPQEILMVEEKNAP